MRVKYILIALAVAVFTFVLYGVSFAGEVQAAKERAALKEFIPQKAEVRAARPEAKDSTFFGDEEFFFPDEEFFFAPRFFAPRFFEREE